MPSPIRGDSAAIQAQRPVVGDPTGCVVSEHSFRYEAFAASASLNYERVRPARRTARCTPFPSVRNKIGALLDGSEIDIVVESDLGPDGLIGQQRMPDSQRQW